MAEIKVPIQAKTNYKTATVLTAEQKWKGANNGNIHQREEQAVL